MFSAVENLTTGNTEFAESFTESNEKSLPSQSTYHANGKLLLSGEYLVLYGAKSIALPLKVGQQMEVSEKADSNAIVWQAFYQDKVWFECRLNVTDFSILETSDREKAETLCKLFQTIRKLNPEFSPNVGIQIKTTLESNPEWGFGSSSTLVSLLALWSGVDAFELNEAVFNGSGFDIACATARGPIFYTRGKVVQEINLNYPFAGNLYFIYSGQKKMTKADVSHFLKKEKPSEKIIEEVSDLSDQFAACSDQREFNRLIQLHEKLIGNLIGETPVKQKYFPDFQGEIKSLGAWGGDFYLVSSGQSFPEIKNYFGNKGLVTMFHWHDLIL